MAHRLEIESFLRELLSVDRFKDYGPNGLQVQGTDQVRRLASGVTASLAFIEAAIDAGADTLLVHHGLFWRGHDGRLTGWLRDRVARLIRADINLLAYHLPLDAHPVLGNNAQLGLRLGWQAQERFGDQDLGFLGQVEQPVELTHLRTQVLSVLGREAVCEPGDGRPSRCLAWCTGGAQGLFEQAIALGVDAYLSGEISEQTVHLARESGVAYIAAGHHATERYGVQALGAHLAQRFGVEHRFIEIDNPV